MYKRQTLNTDLIIAIGSRFSDRVAGNREEFGREAKIIHFDIDASEISKNVASDISIVGDARYILKKMIQRMPETKHDDWTGTLKDFKTKLGLPKPKPGENVDPRDLALTLHEIVGEDAIIVTDVGQHQMIMAQYYQFSRPRSWISSCGLGTMGYGMGAAIGAKVANPHRPVILVTGDGSFHMNMNEMAAAVSANIPIVVLVFNNHVLGMVRQWQTLFYDHRYSHTTIDRQTDFVKLAEAFGGKGLRIQTRHDIKGVMKEALSSRVPCIVDCWIDKDDCVYPLSLIHIFHGSSLWYHIYIKVIYDGAQAVSAIGRVQNIHAEKMEKEQLRKISMLDSLTDILNAASVKKQIPVSYTHLDVYKRQPYGTATASWNPHLPYPVLLLPA